MFHGWDGFYTLTGTAAASLIGLLFVVATLTRRQDQDGGDQVARGMITFTTPTVYHFAVVLVISALALTPHVPAGVQTLVVGAAAVASLLYTGVRGVEIARSPGTPHWSDVWFYGVVPSVVYLLLALVAAGSFAMPEQAPFAVSGLLLALLLVGIRNAWDLVTWLAPRSDKAG